MNRLTPKPAQRKPAIAPTPTLLQMEAVECGAAALGIILSYYNRIVPLPELRQACGVSRDGSKASNILGAARHYGLEAKGFKADLTTLWDLPFPLIVFWNFNHFLVVEGIQKKGEDARVFLNDPATGRRVVSLEEFNEAYTGVVLVFEPGAAFQPGGRHRDLYRALWERLQGSLGALVFCILTGLFLVIPGLAMPAFSQVFIDNVLIQERDEWLRPLILGILVTAILSGFLTRLQLQLLRRTKIKLSMGMSSRFLWHILHLPVSFYDQRFAGEISSRVQLNDSLADLLSGKLATTAIATVMVIFYAIVMLQYDAVLTLIGIAFVIINLLALQWVSRQRVDTNMKLMQEQGKVSGVAISGLQSMETLKASGLESDFFSRWSGYYAKAVNVQQEMDVMNQTLGILPSVLSAIASMLLLVIGGFRVIDGALSIGMLIAFQSLMQQFMEPVNTLVSLGSDLQEMEGNLNRLDDILQNPMDVDPEPSLMSLTQPRLQGYLELRNLTFGYNQAGKPLIENLNLSLKPGQRVALIGGSGSGKSTVAKLVCGLYQPWSGEIYLDGQARSQIPRPIIANSVAYVEQGIHLFSGSVRDNLTLWDTTVSDRQLIQACQDAAIHEVIQALPNGYNTNLLEGASNLSGGQRQRLEIARALVNQPTLLVMDEATSALDTETEKIIDQNLRLRGCTCLIVAHRLSTIRDCDEIIVMEQGKVIQRGTHEELKQREGHYLNLIRSES
ncbi:MAG: NHLP family bacteriocin export ABC transporter peptidase/permease/ATPase subunit [Oculatellaceae cyanobacterium Prado106]|jgi:NHLM bacteriocin system ABC transporter peptidase/ATP-binding protein|nr:NHLP family bacteriocin export ABC transporter peptidase/permease/ATPase subunit [Oculatellaceae cyanobacterium Prado106]